MKKKLTLIFLIAWLTLSAQTQIVGYQYSFNNGQNPVYVAVTPTADFHLQTDIDVSNLNNNVNIFNIRFKDDNGQWSGISSHLFIRQPETAQNRQIVAYEYFFNNDSDNRQYVNVSPIADFNFIADIDVSNLSNNVNIFNIRFKDDNGQWSGITSHLFIKPPEETLNANQIDAYEYWFDDDRSNLRSITVNPAQADLYIADLDMNHIWRGTHTIHTRYRDTYGQYSGITTDTITKLSHPLALFSPSATQICQGESVQFTDNGSIDYDTVQWDFGDGNTSSILNETHVYNTPGNFTATLTVTDTLINVSNSMSVNISVDAAPDNTVSSSHTFPACYGETVTLTANATGMNYLWSNGATTQSIDVTDAGTYSVSITDSNGCSSTSDDIVVSFTAQIDNTVSSSHNFPACYGETVTLTANATGMNYLWSNGATTQSIDVTDAGTYSVSITDSNGCSVTSDDVTVSYYPEIDTTVTVNNNPVELIAQQSNASYQWLDCDNNFAPITGETNQNFIPAASGNYAVEITMNGCTATSDCVNVTLTALENNELYKSLDLFPNPADDFLQIDTDIQVIEIEISNLQGSIIGLQKLSGKQKEVNISRLQAGVYLITIRLLSGEFTGQSVRYKLIKK